MGSTTSSQVRTPPLLWALLIVLLASAVGAQRALDATAAPNVVERSVTWFRSPELIRRVALGFDAMLADVYWIRTVQYYGDTKLSTGEKKNYDLLYPLLDITTSLDPHFSIAYRFGAILLSEGYPNGPGNADQAIALLRKGIKGSPERWQYYHDAAFVEYWWHRDGQAASRWLLEASKLPGAPNWLAPVAASMLAEDGERNSARQLWRELAGTTDQDWLRSAATRALHQLDAEEVIEQLQPIVNSFYDTARRFPTGWDEVIRAGLVRGIPLDPTGVAYTLDPVSGAIDVAKDSTLYPLRRGL